MPGTTDGSTSGSPANSNESASSTATWPGNSNAGGPLFGEPIQAKTWKERVLRQQMLVRQAHEGMMLEKIQRQNKIVADDVKERLGQSASEGEADEMGVSIGNETHYHYQGGGQPGGGEAGWQDGRGVFHLGKPHKGLLWSAIIAALLGGPVATWWLMQQPAPSAPAVTETSPSEPAPTQPAGPGDTDTDTLTDVLPGFGEPQDVE